MNAESGFRIETNRLVASTPPVPSRFAKTGIPGRGDRRSVDTPLAQGQVDRRVMPERRLPSLQYVDFDDFIFSQLVAAGHRRPAANQHAGDNSQAKG